MSVDYLFHLKSLRTGVREAAEIRRTPQPERPDHGNRDSCGLSRRRLYHFFRLRFIIGRV